MFDAKLHTLSRALADRAAAPLARARMSAMGMTIAGFLIGLAALILCPILANEGLPLVAEGYLADLAGRVRSRGGRMTGCAGGGSRHSLANQRQSSGGPSTMPAATASQRAG